VTGKDFVAATALSQQHMLFAACYISRLMSVGKVRCARGLKPGLQLVLRVRSHLTAVTGRLHDRD
jgi:hypothetical protein